MATLVFCYFAMAKADYTPLDIGYIIAQLRRSGPPDDVYITQALTYDSIDSVNRSQQSKKRIQTIYADVERIVDNRPDVLIIFTDSIIWSKFFGLGRALAIAKVLRAIRTHCFIGVAGHKIEPDYNQQIILQGALDCVVSGDVEDALIRLPKLLAREPVKGVTYPNFSKHENGNGIDNLTRSDEGGEQHGVLDDIPSPYLSGVFDIFLKEKQSMRRGNFRSFISSARGCHFDCYYCSRSVKYEQVRHFSTKRFYDEIEYLRTKFAIKRFFVLDDSFLTSQNHLVELTAEFEARLERNQELADIGLFVMARPETLNDQKIEILSKLHVKSLQVGLQSINPAHHRFVGRKNDISKFEAIAHWLSENDIRLYLDVILGLPEDTASWFQETLDYALSLKPYSIQLKQFYLNPFTAFHARQDAFGIKLDEQRDIYNLDFEVPYVVAANGVDERYYNETMPFIKKRIQAHPDIYWKFLSKRGRFVSSAFYTSERGLLHGSNSADLPVGEY